MKTFEQIRENDLLIEYNQAVARYEDVLVLYEGQDLNEGLPAAAAWIALREVLLKGAALLRPAIRALFTAQAAVKGAKWAGKSAWWALRHMKEAIGYSILSGILVYQIFPTWTADAAITLAKWLIAMAAKIGITITWEVAVNFAAAWPGVATVGAFILAFYSKRKATKILDKWHAKHGKKIVFSSPTKKMSKKDANNVTKLIKKYK